MKIRIIAILAFIFGSAVFAQSPPSPPAASWSPSIIYSGGRVVFYSCVTYVSLQNNNASMEPDTSPAWWNPIATAAGCGSGSSLPTATAAGQAPVSTGVGTAYTAQSIIPAPSANNVTVAIVGAGDSRMAGNTMQSGQDLMTRISQQPLFSGIVGYHNGAVGGATCASMTSVYATNVQPYKPGGTNYPTATTVYLFILDGVNDFLSGGLGAQQVIACKQAYLAQAVSDGFTPVLLTSYYATGLAGTAAMGQWQQYNNWERSLAGTYRIIDLATAFSPASLNPFYGSDLSITGNVTAYSVSPGVIISSQTPGSGYSGTPSCVVSGGTFTTAATCTSTLVSGGLVASMTNPGVYSSTTGVSITMTATTAGSGATVTPAGIQIATMTAANSQAIGNIVYLDQFPTSVFLNGLTSGASPNGLPVLYANSTSFMVPVSYANISTTETGRWSQVAGDPTHLGPGANVLEATIINDRFALGATGRAYVPTQEQDYYHPNGSLPSGGFHQIDGSLFVGPYSTNTNGALGDITLSRAGGTNASLFFGSSQSTYFFLNGTSFSVQTPAGIVFSSAAAGGSIFKGGSVTACLFSYAASCNSDTSGYLNSYVSATSGAFRAGSDGNWYLFRVGSTSTTWQFPTGSTLNFSNQGTPTASINVGTGVPSFPGVLPFTIYSAAGTPLLTCAVGIKGEQATVSDATTPTYMGAYASGGSVTAAVICSFNGTTYSWLTH